MGKKVTEDGLVINPPDKWGQQDKLTEEERESNARIRRSLGYAGGVLIASESEDRSEARIEGIFPGLMKAWALEDEIWEKGGYAYEYVWRDEAGGYVPYGYDSCDFADRHPEFRRIRKGEGL